MRAQLCCLVLLTCMTFVGVVPVEAQRTSGVAEETSRSRRNCDRSKNNCGDTAQGDNSRAETLAIEQERLRKVIEMLANSVGGGTTLQPGLLDKALEGIASEIEDSDDEEDEPAYFRAPASDLPPAPRESVVDRPVVRPAPIKPVDAPVRERTFPAEFKLPELKVSDTVGTVHWVGSAWTVFVYNPGPNPVKVLYGVVYDCIEIGLGCGSTGSGYLIPPEQSAIIATITPAVCTDPSDKPGECNKRRDSSFKYMYAAEVVQPPGRK
jgi:hypothetical protein